MYLSYFSVFVYAIFTITLMKMALFDAIRSLGYYSNKQNLLNLWPRNAFLNAYKNT